MPYSQAHIGNFWKSGEKEQRRGEKKLVLGGKRSRNKRQRGTERDTERKGNISNMHRCHSQWLQLRTYHLRNPNNWPVQIRCLDTSRALFSLNGHNNLEKSHLILHVTVFLTSPIDSIDLCICTLPHTFPNIILEVHFCEFEASLFFIIIPSHMVLYTETVSNQTKCVLYLAKCWGKTLFTPPFLSILFLMSLLLIYGVIATFSF